MGLRIFNKRPIAWLVETVRREGPLRPLVIMVTVIGDYWFDWRQGTDTCRRIPRLQIETDSPNKIYATGSGSTKVMAFRGLMRRLRLSPANVFLDLGSGKGRILLLAAEYGFRRIVGVEFSPLLCACARRNLEAFLRRRSSAPPVEVREIDVTRYDFQDDESVLFLYDPFTPPVLNQVLENLRASLARRPRPVWLIYHVPKERGTLDACGLFDRPECHVIWGAEFCVYRAGPAAPA